MNKLIAIAGPSGSGKTTIALKIIEHLGKNKAVLINQDSYYKCLSELPPEKRKKTNFDQPSAVEFNLLTEHMNLLLNGERIKKPNYNFKNQVRSKVSTSINPKELILLEGTMVLTDTRIESLSKLKIYILCDYDIALLRRITRDVVEREISFEESSENYLKTIRPMMQKYIIPQKDRADMIVDYSNSPPIPNIPKLAEIINRL